VRLAHKSETNNAYSQHGLCLPIIVDRLVLCGHIASILSEPMTLANTFAQKLSGPLTPRIPVNLAKEC
jgi:hypothetical protein